MTTSIVTPLDQRPLTAAGALLGVGLGGFVDGIVFHQLLQLHGMLTARLPKTTLENAQVNMFWDGVFHAFTWAATAGGVFLLWRAGRRPEASWSGRALLGAMLFGWGVFNVAEGVVDHYVLDLHHVVERLGRSAWDAAFLGSGVALAAAGVALMRAGKADQGTA